MDGTSGRPPRLAHETYRLASCQIPVAYAHRSYEQAVRSPNRHLRIFTAEEGATEHIGLDRLHHTSTYIADWVADTLCQ